MQSVKVYTGDEWLAAQLDGFTRGDYVVRVGRDLYDRPFIGVGVATNGIWQMEAQFTNPHTNETKPLIDWLTLIDYEPKEITEEDGTI
jgi:hypothetical protein